MKTIAYAVRRWTLTGEEPFDQVAAVYEYFLKLADRLGFILLPILWNETSMQLCAQCDGLIIPGSINDIDPSYYKEDRTPANTGFDEYAYDKRLILYFTEKNLPIIGICAGLQSINVCYGGTLMEDMPGHMDSRHTVTVNKESKLFALCGTERLDTNSYHHQCIEKAAPGCTVSAVSDDGIVEAFEFPGRKIYGFQWHPEAEEGELRDKLFAELLEL